MQSCKNILQQARDILILGATRGGLHDKFHAVFLVYWHVGLEAIQITCLHKKLHMLRVDLTSSFFLSFFFLFFFPSFLGAACAA